MRVSNRTVYDSSIRVVLVYTSLTVEFGFKVTLAWKEAKAVLFQMRFRAGFE